MSLLSQVLALGTGELNMAGVREVLGLAGSEIFMHLMECVRDKDLAGLHGLLGEILDQGADLGFFLRELAVCWCNLFFCCVRWVTAAGHSFPTQIGRASCRERV